MDQEKNKGKSKAKPKAKKPWTELKAPGLIVDIGVNIGHRDFSKDINDVMARCASNNVGILVATGTSVKSSRSVAALTTKKFANVEIYSTAGVHPHDAKTWDNETAQILRDLASKESCVAIGECGIDFDRDFSPRPVQQAVFQKQLELAVELKMPVFLHQRLGFKEFNEILERAFLSQPGVEPSDACVHCFTGSIAELEHYAARGVFVGITGFVCDPKRGAELQEALKKGVLPLSQLLIETDAPFMSPKTVPNGGRRCEPGMLPYVAQTLAQLLNVPLEELCEQTTQNAKKFFRLK